MLVLSVFFFLMIRRPPRSTLDRSSAASDVYKRQARATLDELVSNYLYRDALAFVGLRKSTVLVKLLEPVSYTHLRAHETVLDLVCRLLLEKKKTETNAQILISIDKLYITVEQNRR